MAIKDVLVLHHSHTDVGYTHVQAAWWELSRRFIDEALDVCEETAGWDEASRVRWTCETTGTVVDWLDHASGRNVERFRALCRNGQVAVGAMPFHLTPLVDGDELARSLRAVGFLREEFGFPVKAAIQHDVNGVALGANQLLREIGVELMVMGVNRYFGGVAFPRPSLVKWVGADGGELLTLSGEIYQSFDRVLQPLKGDLTGIADRLEAYVKGLEGRGYAQDFVYLTATQADFGDNNPPSLKMARRVREWNKENRGPVIRFVSSDELASRMKAVPPEKVGRVSGDWSDWWAYGVGSAAQAVGVNQRSKERLRMAEMISAGREWDGAGRLLEKSWQQAMLYGEHTFGSANSVYNTGSTETTAQRNGKESFAYEGMALGAMALRDSLEKLAGNPAHGDGVSGVLVVNASGVKRCEKVMVLQEWVDGKWAHFNSKVHQLDFRVKGPWIGPVEVEAWSCRWIPREEWVMAGVEAEGCESGTGFVESKFLRLDFAGPSGRVLGLRDKRRGCEVLDGASEWGAFEMVRETADLSEAGLGGLKLEPRFFGRDVIFDPDWAKVHREESGWRTGWKAVRESPRVKSVSVRKEADGIVWVRKYEAGCGVRDLEIEVKLRAEAAEVEVGISFYKEDVRTPEGLYVALPTGLKNWRAWWGGSDVTVELEAGQMPTACRDFVATGKWLAVAGEGGSVTLALPDMPLAQVGGFTFGRELQRVERGRTCLMLAWMMNNYWDTNFNASQPGEQRLRYGLKVGEGFDAKESAEFGGKMISPLVVHPVVGKFAGRQERMAEVEGVVLLSVRQAASGSGVAVRLANPKSSEVQGRMRVKNGGGEWRTRAWLSNSLERRANELSVREGWVNVKLRGGEIYTVVME